MEDTSKPTFPTGSLSIPLVLPANTPPTVYTLAVEATQILYITTMHSHSSFNGSKIPVLILSLNASDLTVAFDSSLLSHEEVACAYASSEVKRDGLI